MKHRFLAFGLAVCLSVGLAACGGAKDGDVPPTPDPSESVTASPAGTVEPTDIPDKGTPAPSDEVSAQPSQTPPAGSAEPTAQPTPTPAIGDPTAPPSAAPSAEPEPSDTPSIAPTTAASLRELFMLSSSNSDAPTADFSDMSAYLENFYNLSADDLEDFVFYKPDMSTAIQEFFLAKVKSGKVDAVKAACQSRLDGLKEEAEFYPGTADFVSSAQLETVGDWVVLAVCPEAGRMVKILQDTVK